MWVTKIVEDSRSLGDRGQYIINRVGFVTNYGIVTLM
jgi:hypothetical protein